MTPDERRQTWLTVYREIRTNMRVSDRSQPAWQSGAQLAWARGEAHRQLETFERELAGGRYE